MSSSATEKKVNRKRQIVAAAMVFVLGAGLFVNWYFSSNISLKTSNTTTASEKLGEAQYVNATTSSYFAESKLKRQKTMDETLEKLNEVIDNDKASSDEKKEAVSMYSKLSERAALESDIETLILAKGISECVVVLGESTCEVVVNSEKLDESTALQIKEIVQNKANTDASKITVSTAG